MEGSPKCRMGSVPHGTGLPCLLEAASSEQPESKAPRNCMARVSGYFKVSLAQGKRQKPGKQKE